MVTFEGILRLAINEYEPISKLLDEVLLPEPPTLTLNIQSLKVLNSSGIIVLSKFVVKTRRMGNVELAVRGSKNILWHGKTLQNLKGLMPSLNSELVG